MNVWMRTDKGPLPQTFSLGTTESMYEGQFVSGLSRCPILNSGNWNFSGDRIAYSQRDTCDLCVYSRDLAPQPQKASKTRLGRTKATYSPGRSLFSCTHSPSKEATHPPFGTNPQIHGTTNTGTQPFLKRTKRISLLRALWGRLRRSGCCRS